MVNDQRPGHSTDCGASYLVDGSYFLDMMSIIANSLNSDIFCMVLLSRCNVVKSTDSVQYVGMF